ncbi:KAP family P-loop domain-containing protein [Pedobacter sp. ok626]|uniref:YobI family P-loop NTPase n=1 Tax=Pedobacter sp. ok626 TaxID=1761882 RepID=UPI00089095A1|nr:P-loop NTPase fold protein [Pedobacter sp. ok626]SDK92869.1 KAP family P-loop domain-containing protein [Pedobacter sp. ok626]
MLVFSLMLFISLLFLLLNIQYWKITIAAIRGQVLSLKKWFYHFLDGYIAKLQIVRKNLYYVIKPKNEELFESLTPIEDGDSNDIYDKALSFSLFEKDIKNIALTGPYGSGKSTILRTFQKNHKEFKYLNISLASFKVHKDDVDPDNELIEVSILQQIFYHEKHNTIPDSRFKRIRKASKTNLLLKAALLILCGICFFYLSKSSPLPAIPESKSFLSNFRSYLLVAALLIISVGGLYLVYTILKLYNNSKFNKVNLTSGEVELSDHSEASILNKHLDEILYFFEVTSYNVVIIEDLDRFQNPEIYTKLREINNLINNSKQVDRRIVFIYALKDDIFTDEKRTKFFDFVIPVIPVINTSNSEAKLLERLEKANVFPELSKDFVSEIALYINDMRLLKNVFNEFILYKAKLGGFELNPNNLLATILYKNLYPTDFAELNKGEGSVFGFFAKKGTYIEHITKAKEERLKFIEEKQASLEFSVLKDKFELRSLYIAKMFQLFPDYTTKQVYLGNSQVNLEELKTDENFPKLKLESVLHYYTTNGYGKRSSGYTFNAIETQVDENQTYEEREQQILSRVEYFSEQTKKEAEGIRTELQNISILPFSKIIADLSDDELDHSIKESAILLFLIRNGYINEDYHDYTSHFYEGTLTRKDKVFLLSIKNHKPMTADYILDNPFNLIEKIKLLEFSQYEVLNYSLLDSLLQFKDKYEAKLNAFLKLIVSNTIIASQFRDSYLEKGKQVPKFVKTLFAQWEGFWDFVVIESGFSDEKKLQYLKLILDHADLETIKSLNKKGNLRLFISKEKGFLTVMQQSKSSDKIKTILKLLSVKFNDLDIAEGQNEYFEVVYENDFYQLNAQMIHKVLLFKEIETDKPSDQFNKANYTTIRDSGLTKLQQYVERSIDDYIKDVFLTLGTNKDESAQNLINLYNNEDIDLENRTAIIEAQNTIIEEFDPVDEHFWSDLMKAKKISPKWTNLYPYYQKKDGLDLHFVSFLNVKDNFEALSKLDVTKQDGDQNDIEKFALAIATNDMVSVESFKSLISSFPYEYDDLDISAVHPEKVSVMVDHRFLLFTDANYNMLKANFNGENIRLGEQFSEEFMAEFNAKNLDANDFLLVIKSQKFTYDQKIAILKMLTVDILSGNKDLEAETLGILITQYEDINYSVIEHLLGGTQDIEKKVRLLNLHLKRYNPEQITGFLRALGGKYAEIADRNEPRLDRNDANEEFASILDDMDYVSSVTTKPEFVRLNHYRSNGDS